MQQENNPQKEFKNLNVKIQNLSKEDSLYQLFEIQSMTMERLGRLALSRSSNMKEKSKILKEEIYDLNDELHEIIKLFPHKHWKTYSEKAERDWLGENHRQQALEEYVDAFHFFIDIALFLEFSPEEVFSYYLAKNKENHERWNNGY